jgi:hypothetical protein
MMSATHGKRRIDRVLAEDYLDGLADLPLPQVRELRDDAEQEETDLSYVRRLLQGRIDIIRAEIARRSGDGAGDLVGSLPDILADERGGPRGLGRHQPTEPSRVDEHRRRAEALVADVDVADVVARTDEELRDIVAECEAQEREYSDKRRAVQAVVDRCSAEIARRYREGEADVTDLLNR